MDARPQQYRDGRTVRTVLVTGEWTLGRNESDPCLVHPSVLVTGEWTLGRNHRKRQLDAVLF